MIVDDGEKTTCSTATAETIVKVNTPPMAHASMPMELTVGKAIAFDASASSDPDGDALQYQWDFGDGSRGEGISLEHIYKERGSYNVKLTVDDGSATACAQNEDSSVVDIKSAPVAVMSIR